MCKVNVIREACEAGARDGRVFTLDCNEEIVRIFSHQFWGERERAAYCSSFWAEFGRRISPVNDSRYLRACRVRHA